MKPMSDAPILRRICLQMSAAGYGDVEYFMSLPIDELKEMLDETSRIVKKRRARNAVKK